MEKGVRFIGNGQAPGKFLFIRIFDFLHTSIELELTTSPPILGGDHGVLERWYFRYQVPSYSPN